MTFEAQMAEIEQRIAELERSPDGAARESARALLARALEIHRAALAKMLEIVAASAAGPAIVAQIAAAPEAASVLLLHGLHPLDLPARAEAALDTIERMLAGMGARVRARKISGDSVQVTIAGGAGARVRAQAELSALLPDATVEVAIEEDGFVPLARLSGAI